MKKRMWAVVVAVCAVLGIAVGPVLAETPTGLRDGETVLVSESDTQTEGLAAFHGGQSVAVDALDWSGVGVHGQALRLDGQTDYLEYTGAAAASKTLSGAVWVNWQGSATEDAAGEIGQRLWTLYRDEKNYFSVSLRGYYDNIKEVEGGVVFRIDGVYMEYVLSGVMGRQIKAYNPTTGDVNYAIPKDVWTHLAFTLDEDTMRLYVNGRQWFEEDLSGVAELDATCLRLGGALGDGPTLNAIVDDAALFTQVLDPESIRTLSQGAALDFTGATEATTFRPTKPTEPDDGEDEDNSVHIPIYAWIVVGAGMLGFVIAIVVANRGGKGAGA